MKISFEKQFRSGEDVYVVVQAKDGPVDMVRSLEQLEDYNRGGHNGYLFSGSIKEIKDDVLKIQSYSHNDEFIYANRTTDPIFKTRLEAVRWWIHELRRLNGEDSDTKSMNETVKESEEAREEAKKEEKKTYEEQVDELVGDVIESATKAFKKVIEDHPELSEVLNQLV